MRLSFVNALKQFDPLDARVLMQFRVIPTASVAWPNHVAQSLGISVDEAAVSVENLIRLGCLMPQAAGNPINNPVTAFGRELLRAVS